MDRVYKLFSLILIQSQIVINVNCCCCRNKIPSDKNNKSRFENIASYKYHESYYSSEEISEENNISKEIDPNIIQKLDENISKTEQQEDFKAFKTNIEEKCNKGDLDPEIIYLLFNFTKDKKIEKIEKIEEEITESLNNCKKIIINGDQICYIKQQSYSDKIYFDILTEIGLLDYKYYFSKKYVLTEHVDQNINENADINDDNLVICNEDDKNNLKNMISKIKNFKKYNFFCSLLKLGDCNLTNRLDNSYFKNDVGGYKVLLLDVDNPSSIDMCDKGVKYEKFYNVLNSKTRRTIYAFSSVNVYTKIPDKLDKIPYLTALTTSFTIFEDSIDITDHDFDILKKYSPTREIEERERFMLNSIKDEKFIKESLNNDEFKYKPKKKYTNPYPTNFILALYDMATSFIKESKAEDKEKGFLEYILPLLWKYAGIANFVEKNNKGKYDSIKTLDLFKKVFLENYNKNKNLLIAVDTYYRSYERRDSVFSEMMNVEKFTSAENNEIREDLKKLISFINANGSEYDKNKINEIKANFNYLKTNNMFPNIINGINF